MCYKKCLQGTLIVANQPWAQGAFSYWDPANQAITEQLQIDWNNIPGEVNQPANQARSQTRSQLTDEANMIKLIDVLANSNFDEE